jgi:hypothetical protein
VRATLAMSIADNDFICAFAPVEPAIRTTAATTSQFPMAHLPLFRFSNLSRELGFQHVLDCPATAQRRRVFQ